MLRNDRDFWVSKPLVAAPRESPLDLYPTERTLLKRPRQRDCRHEPSYPGEDTVMFSMADPDLVSHGIMGRCFTAHPHRMADCKEFISTERDEYSEAHRWEYVP